MARDTKTDPEPDDTGNGSRVKVPDTVGGEIVFTRGVDVVAKFKVKDGHVTVKTPAEQRLLLGNVAGAEVVDT